MQFYFKHYDSFIKLNSEFEHNKSSYRMFNFMKCKAHYTCLCSSSYSTNMEGHMLYLEAKLCIIKQNDEATIFTV